MRYDGRTTRRRLKKLHIKEVSTVDYPAHGPGARVALLKRRASSTEKRMAVTTQTDGHAHTIIMVDANSEGLSERRAGQTSFANGHVHDWIRDDAGNVIVADSVGHTHGLSALVTKADLDALARATDTTPEDGAGRLDKGNRPATHKTAEDIGTDLEAQQMADKTEKTAENEAVQKQLDQLQKSNDRLAAIVKLSPESRAHFDSLEGEAADAFLKLSPDAQGAELQKRTESDPVVYTTMEGTEIRKSAGAAFIELAKSNDDLRKQVLASETVTKRAALVKRADEELGHLSGDADAKADLLGAVDSLPTEKRDPVLAILKSHDAGMAAAFDEIGTVDSGAGHGSDAHAKVEAIAKRLQKDDPSLTPARAYVAALDTPEGRELHSELAG